MKAIYFDGKLKYVKNHHAPTPEEGEALIRVTLAGICNTDLEIMRGYLGFQGIMGHEFVGVVENANNGNRSLVGKRVVGEINCGCGTCNYCLTGFQKHCPDQKTIGILSKDGAFAEYITLPTCNLLEVPDNISDEEAVFAEPLAAAFEILEQLHIKPTDRILVLGDGKLGILASLVLNLTQANVTLAGRHGDKLRVAREQHVKTIRAGELEMKEQYDVVVEATGSADGFDLALKLVRPRGVIVLKTTVAYVKEMNLARVVIDEVQVIGSRCGPFEPALMAMAKKLINVKPLISAIYKPDKALAAFKKASKKGSLKVLLDFR
ncbi:MAG: alcohol dehydrogenase catalytic domain-containing protein [Proteobacteria bacterium]|nr:alcohol dehydrogenase catalytic domain-containing protein [Pseudomonadota bacterium]